MKGLLIGMGVLNALCFMKCIKDGNDVGAIGNALFAAMNIFLGVNKNG